MAERRPRMSADLPITLAMGDHSFRMLSHEAALDLIVALGFDGVKLAVWEGQSHIQPSDVRADPARWAARLGERFAERSLVVVDVVCLPEPEFTALGLNHPGERERETARRFVADMIDFVARLGTASLTVYPGFNWPHEAHEVSLMRGCRELERHVAAAQELELTLLIEPHVHTVCETPADALRVCEEVPGLGLALDYSQFVAQGIAVEEANALIPRARFVHARGARLGHLQASARENEIDWQAVVSALGADGYRGSMAIEFYPDFGDERLDVLSETAALRDLLRASVASLVGGSR
jgi:sugar phosphate isomerase/epimerase